MKMKKRLLSILLSLALVLGLMPGMVMTAYAAMDQNKTFKAGDTIHSGFPMEWICFGDENNTRQQVDDCTIQSITYNETSGKWVVSISTWEDPVSLTYPSQTGKVFVGLKWASTSGNPRTNGYYQLTAVYEDAPTVAVTGVTLNPSAAQTIDLDGKVSFTATVEPNNATDKTVKWSFSDKVKLFSDADCTSPITTDTVTNILTVYVKGISAGVADISVVSNANVNASAVCNVAVAPTTAISPAGAGTVSFTGYDDLQFKATANSGYEFDHWSYSEYAYNPTAQQSQWTEKTSASNPGTWMYYYLHYSNFKDLTAHFKADLIPVTITAADKEVAYSVDGIAIPVEGMFTIPTGAGAATYSVMNGTGTGTYDAQTGKLSVTTCGTFTVKVSTAASDTHAAGAEVSATLTVNKADPTTPTGLTATYGQTLANVTLPDGWTWVDSTQSVGNVGSNTFKADFAGNDNYNSASNVDVSVNVSIADNPLTYAETQTVTKPFSTSAQTATLEAAENGVGELSYGITSQKKGEDTVDYFTLNGTTLTLAANTPVGTYTVVVYVRATGNSNYYNGIKQSTITVTVNKADPTVTAPTAKTLTYNGSKQDLVNAGSATGGTMYYAVTTDNTAPTDESLYATSIPEKTDVGTYYVWYKVKGDENHTDSAAKCVEASISEQGVTTFTVTFNTDGGTPAPKKQTVEAGGYATRPEPNPSKVNMEFDNWYHADGTTKFAFKGEAGAYQINGDTTVLALWIDRTYTVTFDAKGGSPEPDTQTVPSGGKASRPDADPARDGYTFGGWQLAGAAYDFDTPVTGNITLTAAWTENSKPAGGAVTFDNEAGVDTGIRGIGGSQDAQDADTGVSELKENLKALAESAGAGQVTMELKTEQDLTKTADSDLNTEQRQAKKEQTAIQEKAKNIYGKDDTTVRQDYVSINLKKADSSGVEQPLTEKEMVRVLEIPLRYDLTGRYNPNVFRYHGDSASALRRLASRPASYQDLNGCFYVSGIGSSAVIYIYSRLFSTYSVATTGTESYTVLFDANGGTGTMAGQSAAAGTSVKLNLNGFTRNGYSFTGWNTSPDGKGTSYANRGSVTLTGDLTLYAQWRKNDPAPTPSRPSYSGGGSSGGSSAPANPTVTVPVSGDSSSVSVSAALNGSTAEVKEPTSSELERVIGAGVKTGTVVVDLSGLNKDVGSATIPTSTVRAIEQAVSDPKNDAKALTVKLPDGSVTFDAKALAAIVGQAKGDSIWLNVDRVGAEKLRAAQRAAVAGKDVQEVYDIYLTSNGVEIHDLKGGSAEVTVTYTLKAGQSAANVETWYVSDDGKTVEEVPTVSDGKTVKANVGHFSCYAIVYNPKHGQAEPEQSACPQDSTCPAGRFTDTDPKAWYHDGVHYALENGIMSGMGGGSFAPNGTTTRAMLAQMLWNLSGKPAYAGRVEFNDVDAAAWYAPAVRWASAEGIITGYDDPDGSGKLFAPNAPVTREQLAAMLYRYAQSKGQGFTGAWMFRLDYPDAAEVSEWADEAMHWMTMHGIVNGIDGRLAPQENATRAQVAVMFMRCCEELAK